MAAAQRLQPNSRLLFINSPTAPDARHYRELAAINFTIPSMTDK
jgi:hypothetical protein